MKTLIQFIILVCLIQNPFFIIAQTTTDEWRKWKMELVAIDYRNTSQSLDVPADEANVKSFKIAVNGNPLFLRTVSVTFDNNEVQSFQIDREIKTNTRTEELVLEKKDRLARKITLYYEVRKAKITPLVEIVVRK